MLSLLGSLESQSRNFSLYNNGVEGVCWKIAGSKSSKFMDIMPYKTGAAWTKDVVDLREFNVIHVIYDILYSPARIQIEFGGSGWTKWNDVGSNYILPISGGKIGNFRVIAGSYEKPEATIRIKKVIAMK